MPRQAGQIPPSYSLHKASGRAVVRIDGFGGYGSSNSHQQYERLVTEWRVGKHRATGGNWELANGRLTVYEVLLRERAKEFAIPLREGR